MNIENKTLERLLKAGVKPSLQRIAIMEYLLTHSTHPTVDMIYSDLAPIIPTLSKTTVYNTLKLLSEQGAILSLNIDEKNVRYDGDISAHAHFRCKSCIEIFDFPLEGDEFSCIKNPGDFQVTECQVYYTGYCEKCRKDL